MSTQVIKYPSTSPHFLSSLPLIIITIDDILNENTKECIICFDLFEIGGIYCKLDCGHIFHSNCIIEWLNKQCTCPECRYEYESISKEFEIERKLRMKNRKLRLRKDELYKKSIKQLKDIFEIYNINTN